MKRPIGTHALQAPAGEATGALARRPLFIALTLVVVASVAIVLSLAYAHHRSTRPVYLEGEAGSGLRLLFDETLGWRNVPNERGTTYGHPMTTNPHGHRGPAVSRRKPAGTKRILILGDSFAWGFSVADEHVLDRVLERDLPTTWQVLNAGVSGWGTDQEYLYLMNEGFAFEPDIVVLALFLANDFANNSSSRMYQRQKPVFLDLDLQLANVPVPRPGEPAAEIRSQADAVPLTARIVNAMADACRKHDCVFVPMWFGRYLDPDNATYRTTTRLFESLLVPQDHVYPLDLDAAFASVGADLRMLTRGGPDRHWNRVGHEIAAELLRRHLFGRGLVK